MGYIILHKIDVEEKQARYYALTWRPAITGQGWAVERAWGSLDSSRRQYKTAVIEDYDAVVSLVRRHLQRRFQHDYSVSETDEAGQALLERIETSYGECNEAEN